ncbi:MAG: CCA tRNA nucleotidyltransferase [Dongiaceae bacterium]
MTALAAAGGEARFVGGCVRDALLGRKVNDVDIATHEPPERVMNLLARAGIKAIPTGIKHGTVTAVIGGRHFEITTLRRDIETYGRHAKVEYTDDWQADAARRDFTMNALFCGADGTVYDPFGGLADLRAQRVRFVGDPEARIREDVLRLLRFFRFHAHYGKPPPDAVALAACRELAPLLPTLSGERLCGETLKLLSAPHPADVVELMQEDGVLKYFLPEATRIDRLRALVTIEESLAGELAARVEPIRRLAALLDGSEPSALAAARRLRLSNAERDRLVGLASDADLSPGLSESTRHRLIYRYGRERYRDLVLVRWADAVAGANSMDRGREEGWRELLHAGTRWAAPRFPIRGRDAVRLGVPPGPAVGRLMAALEDWWIAGDFQADRATCLAKLEELAATAT